MKKIREKDIENAIIDYANQYLDGIVKLMKIETAGVFDPTKKIFRPPGRHVLKGTPDIIGVTNKGQMILIEVKTPESIRQVRNHYNNIVERKTLPKSISNTIVAQVLLIEEFKSMGAVGFFCSSVDEFLRLLLQSRVICRSSLISLF